MTRTSIGAALAFLISFGMAHADQAAQAYESPPARSLSTSSGPVAPSRIGTSATPSTVGLYAMGLAVGVDATFWPLHGYWDCKPTSGGIGTPLPYQACLALQEKTNSDLTTAATQILGGAVKEALASGGGSSPGSVAVLPPPKEITGVAVGPAGQPMSPGQLYQYQSLMADQQRGDTSKPFGQQLAALPFMERRAALVAIKLRQQVHVSYQGKVQNGEAPDVLGIFINPLKKNRSMVFDGTAKLTYTATYTLYSVDTGQVLRTGVIGPLTTETPSFHASWRFVPKDAGKIFIHKTWNLQDLIAQGRIQDPRTKVIGDTLKAMAPQVEAATKASLADWPQVVQAADQLLAGQH